MKDCMAMLARIDRELLIPADADREALPRERPEPVRTAVAADIDEETEFAAGERRYACAGARR